MGVLCHYGCLFVLVLLELVHRDIITSRLRLGGAIIPHSRAFHLTLPNVSIVDEKISKQGTAFYGAEAPFYT